MGRAVIYAVTQDEVRRLVISVNSHWLLSTLHLPLVFSDGIKYMGFVAIICCRDFFHGLWVMAVFPRLKDDRI